LIELVVMVVAPVRSVSCDVRSVSGTALRG
jgi:hypothetical protein